MSFTSRSDSLLHNRDFGVAVAARALSLFGDLMTMLTLALLVQSRGERPVVVAALFAAGLVPMVLLAPVIGRLVDTVDSRVLLCTSGLGAALAALGVAYAPSTGWLLVLVAVVGALAAVEANTWSALIPSIVGLERVARASGINQAASAVAMLLAPAAAGVLTGWVGYHVPLVIDAVTFAVIALAGATIRTRRRPQVDTSTGTGGGWTVLRRDRVLRAAIALLASFVVLANCINVIDVYLVRDTLQLSSTWFGLFAAAWGGGAVIGAAVASRVSRQRGLIALLLAGCALVGAAAVCLGLARSAGWLVPVAIAGGFGNGWTNSGVNALVMLRSPEAVRGRVSAAIGAVMGAAQLAAYVLGGALSAVLAPRALLTVIGVIGLVLVAAWTRPLLEASRPGAGRTGGPSRPTHRDLIATPGQRLTA